MKHLFLKVPVATFAMVVCMFLSVQVHAQKANLPPVQPTEPTDTEQWDTEYAYGFQEGKTAALAHDPTTFDAKVAYYQYGMANYPEVKYFTARYIGIEDGYAQNQSIPDLSLANALYALISHYHNANAWNTNSVWPVLPDASMLVSYVAPEWNQP